MSIQEKLEDYGYDTEELFLPEELDDAFVGIAVTDWHYNRPIYNVAKLDGINIPEIKESFKQPIFITYLEDIEDCDLKEYVRFSPEELDSSIIAITDEGQVVYEYGELFGHMMEVEGWTSEETADWISFNTLRDYSYRNEGPVVFDSLEYIIGD